MRKYSKLALLITIALLGLTARADFAPQFTNQVDALLQKALNDRKFSGLSVVIVDQSGSTWTKHYGFRDIEKQLIPDDHTIYELGSITKTFTRLLLADQTDIELTDPISKYLPIGITEPKPAGHDIRIQDLALHTGIRLGVPCVPDNVDFSKATWACFGLDEDPLSPDPWKNVNRSQLLKFIDAYSSTVAQFPSDFPAPGTFYEYSNTGMGLLGEMLAVHGGITFEDLLTNKLLSKLGMTETKLSMPCEEDGSCRDLAKVYRPSVDGKSWTPSSLWHLDGMPAAGAARSSIVDMTQYLKFEMGLLKQPSLSDALARSQMELPNAESELRSNICPPDATTGQPCNRSVAPQFLGWPSDNGKSVFYHAGETGASQSMILFTQDHKLGMVLLANSVPSNTYPPEHVPNDLSLCIAQLAGIYPSSLKLCDKFVGTSPHQ